MEEGIIINRCLRVDEGSFDGFFGPRGSKTRFRAFYSVLFMNEANSVFVSGETRVLLFSSVLCRIIQAKSKGYSRQANRSKNSSNDNFNAACAVERSSEETKIFDQCYQSSLQHRSTYPTNF